MEPIKEEKKREDTESTTSSLPGIAGVFETLLRRFRILTPVVVLLVVYVIILTFMGVCLVPFLYLFTFTLEHTQHWPQFFHFAALGTSITIGFFLYGCSLIFVIPFVNFIFPTRLKPWRGGYYSLQTVPWYLHNALTYVVRYTFLKFITPTPFNILFYRLMGMKIGKGVQINTVNISDPCLMELEDKVTIGGSATLICHYGTGGFLVIAPTKLKKGVTIGLKATIMGDVEIGENSKILANSVVLPKTRIPPGEIWGGVPAQFIRKVKKD